MLSLLVFCLGGIGMAIGWGLSAEPEADGGMLLAFSALFFVLIGYALARSGYHRFGLVLTCFAILGIASLFFSPVEHLNSTRIAVLLAAIMIGIALLLAMRYHLKKEALRTMQLKVSEENLRSLAENASDAMLVHSDGKIVFANQRLAEIIGIPVAEILSLPLRRILPPEEVEKVETCFEIRMDDRNEPSQYETALRTTSGNIIPAEISVGTIRWNGKRAALALIRDITSRKRILLEMTKLTRAVEQTEDTIMITDHKGFIEYVNFGFEKVTGYDRKDVIGKKPSFLKSGKQDEIFYKFMWNTILKGKSFSDVFTNRRKDGSLYYGEQTISPIKNEAAVITHFIASGKDITDRIADQERLHYLANHDILTGLPNRYLFLERLGQAALQTLKTGNMGAIFILDLDGFKRINDSLGHEIGDKLLISLTGRLQSIYNKDVLIARIGGDEFGILITNIEGESEAAQLATRAFQIFENPFAILRESIYATGSIGISLFPNDGDRDTELVKHAELAMYRAKETGKNQYQFYAEELSLKAHIRLTLETRLNQALENEEFRIVYQPIVELGAGKIVGAEALLRWDNPESGEIMPATFIPILEDTGLIVPVGAWALGRALHEASKWIIDAEKTDFKITVNLSRRQFSSAHLLNMITQALEDANLPPKFLELEITEGYLMQEVDSALAIMHEIRKKGIRLAIDDFGVGYSSLGYLSRFPVQTLKIDKSFVDKINASSEDALIVKATIALAESLKLDVVAEGVETKEQLQSLRDIGCTIVQGFLFSRPVESDIIRGLIQSDYKNILNG